MSIFPPSEISNGVFGTVFHPIPLQQRCNVGLDHKIFRYGAASALRSSHLQTLSGLIFSGWIFGEAELGWWEIRPHCEWVFVPNFKNTLEFC